MEDLHPEPTLALRGLSLVELSTGDPWNTFYLLASRSLCGLKKGKQKLEEADGGVGAELKPAEV